MKELKKENEVLSEVTTEETKAVAEPVVEIENETGSGN